MIDREELIEKFLNEELNDIELAMFKEKWTHDMVFVNAVRGQAALKIALGSSERINLQEQKETGKKATQKSKWYTGMAASLVLLLTASTFIWWQSTTSAHDLAQTHMIHLRIQGSRGAVITIDRWSAAIQAYANGSTPEAISLLKKELDVTNDKGRYLYTLGDLFLTSSEPDSALHYYRQATGALPGDPFTQWNTAMAWLQKGELSIAKKLLTDMKAPYNKRAQQLFKTMDKPGFRLKNWFFMASTKPNNLK